MERASPDLWPAAETLPRAVPDRLQVELVDAPLTAGRWEEYEAATRSYTCTRAFVEHFERPSAPTLALVRAPPAPEVRAAFLFEREGATSARVLGRFYAPSAEALGAFVEAVFARNPTVARVAFTLVDALEEPRVLQRPTFAVRESADLRLDLGGGFEAYRRSLDPEFVKRCAYHERHLARAVPGASFTTVEGEDIPRAWVAEIVRLNHARMTAKSMESVFDAAYEEGIFTVARRHGCVTVLRDGDRLCAGVVNIRCGSESFGWVIGHDDAYAKFRPGRLCMLAALQELAGRGVRTHHLLLGDSPYKRELGARPAPVASYVVLRGWAALTPRDVVRVGVKRSALLSRRILETVDAIVARAVHRQEPVSSAARDVLHRAQQVVRTARRLRGARP